MSHRLVSLFASLTHGVYVVGVADGDRKNTFTAAWVMQSSFDPPMLALSINPQHASYPLLKAGGGFTVNVLASGQRDLAMHFAKPMAAAKLASIEWHEAKGGGPVLNAAMAWFECRLSAECPSGDHVLVVARVVDGGLVEKSACPMNYREVSSGDSVASRLPETLQP